MEQLFATACAKSLRVSPTKVRLLVVSEIYVNPGATLKRMRARAKGSGNRILKRTSHIHIKVAVAE